MGELNTLDTAGLTAKQQEALALLVAGNSPLQTAKQCKISVDTIYSWRSQHPIFGDLEKRIIRGRLQEAVRQVQGMVPIVLTTLLNLVTDPDTSPRDRIAACKLLLELAGIDARIATGAPDTSGEVAHIFQSTANAIASLVRSHASAG